MCVKEKAGEGGLYLYYNITWVVFYTEEKVLNNNQVSVGKTPIFITGIVK